MTATDTYTPTHLRHDLIRLGAPQPGDTLMYVCPTAHDYPAEPVTITAVHGQHTDRDGTCIHVTAEFPGQNHEPFLAAWPHNFR